VSHAIKAGATDQILLFRAYEDDGDAKTDLTASTTGLTLSVFRIGAAPVSISSLSNKAADNTTHADGAIRQIQGNLYSVDAPDAACASQVPSICVKGAFTGGVIEGVPHPIVGYDATAIRVGAAVAGDAMTLSTGAITAAAIATDAVTEIQTGLATQASVDDLQTDVTTLLGRITATLFSGMTSLGDWLRRLARNDVGTDGMIAAEAEIDTGGTSTFDGTTDSLEALADSSGGGDAEQATLEAVETTVNSIAASISGASEINVTSRVAAGGEITAYIGDDFRVRSGTELEISVSDVAGALYTKYAAIGAANLIFGASRPGKPAGAITGTVASLAQSGSGASQLVILTVEITECGVGLSPAEDYTYQIEQRQTQGSDVDSLVEIEGTLVLKRRVTA